MAEDSKKQRTRDRRHGRVIALHLAYGWDSKGCEDDEGLGIVDADDIVESSTEARTYGKQVLAGFVNERVAVDACIDKRLQNWTLHRMAVIDRSLLRLGCYELLYCPEVPTKVIINEYIELGKTYGSEAKTPKLLNGVLDRIAKDHRTAGNAGQASAS